jgi:hypothetical protein
MIEVEPQPRIDVRVEDGASGEPRRLTTYTGLVWCGGRVGMDSMTDRFHTDRFDTPFFLPDSLPYDPARGGDVSVTVTIGLQGIRDWSVLLAGGSVQPDPRGQVGWVQVRLVGKGNVPVCVSYRVEVVAPPDAVLAQHG